MSGAPVRHRMLLIYYDAWFQTITGVVVTAILVLPLLPLIAGTWAALRQRRGSERGPAWRTSVLDVGLTYGTVVPIWLTMLPGGHRAISLIPFRDMVTTPPYEIVGNMLLLAVVGFLAPMRFRGLASVPRTALLALVLSCGIETCQYVLPIGRVASVDDVLLNTTGAALAAIASRSWWARESLPASAEARRATMTTNSTRVEALDA